MIKKLLLLSFVSCSCLAFHLLFLTHINELRRCTNTAGICRKNLLSDQTTTCTWKGRCCNGLVEEQIKRLRVTYPTAYLLFTDRWSNPVSLSSLKETSSSASSSASSSPSPSPSSSSSSTLYILLDSTWTEAKNLYRKGPADLRRLPLLSLDEGVERSSIYSLRHNFGFVSKFAKNMDEDDHNHHLRNRSEDNFSRGNLLCTAECVCRILEFEGCQDISTKIMEDLLRMQSQS